MRRSASFLAVLMFSILVTVLLADLSSAVAGGGNCQDKLVGNSYNCSFVNSNGSSGSECIEFNVGVYSSHFDAWYGGIDEYGCACDPQGSSFDASSNTYECSAPSSSPSNSFLLIGKINGKKLSEQGLAADGFQYTETCKLSSSPC